TTAILHSSRPECAPNSSSSTSSYSVADTGTSSPAVDSTTPTGSDLTRQLRHFIVFKIYHNLKHKTPSFLRNFHSGDDHKMPSLRQPCWAQQKWKTYDQQECRIFGCIQCFSNCHDSVLKNSCILRGALCFLLDLLRKGDEGEDCHAWFR
ncbi:hypothetical protein Tcan_15073, partial [Toxocara canis]